MNTSIHDQHEDVPINPTRDAAYDRTTLPTPEAEPAQQDTKQAPGSESIEDHLATAISGIQYYIDVNPETRFLHGAIGSLRQAQRLNAATPPAQKQAAPSGEGNHG